MAAVVAPGNSKKRNNKSFKCEIPIFKPSSIAESVEVLDKGLTTNILTIYFFSCNSKTSWQSSVIATRAIDVTKIRPPTTAHKTQTNKHESTCSFD